MRFVTVSHPQFGTTRVPETRVPHLANGWTVAGDQAPPAEPDGDESSSSSAGDGEDVHESEPSDHPHKSRHRRHAE